MIKEAWGGTRALVLAVMLLFAPLATSACAVPIVSAEQTLIDEKSMYGAEAAYNIAANAYVTADAVGALDAASKAKVKPLMISAYSALVAARTAYRLANADSFYEQVALVKKLSEEARAVIPHT